MEKLFSVFLNIMSFHRISFQYEKDISQRECIISDFS